MTHVSPRIIGLVSGKGGVGRTTVAVTLATLFASAGYKTLLFDGSFGQANVDVQLGMVPRVDIADILVGKCPMTQAVSSVEHLPLDVIAGRSGSLVLGALTEGQQQMLADDLSILATHYDIVMIDFAAGVDGFLKLMMPHLTEAFVLTADEPTALAGAYALIETLENKIPLSILVNAAASEKEGERTYTTLMKACESFLKKTPPLQAIIRRDTLVKDAIRAQQPLLFYAPKSEALADMTRLIEK